jgi:hypothetical protein
MGSLVQTSLNHENMMQVCTFQRDRDMTLGLALCKLCSLRDS